MENIFITLFTLAPFDCPYTEAGNPDHAVVNMESKTF